MKSLLSKFPSSRSLSFLVLPGVLAMMQVSCQKPEVPQTPQPKPKGKTVMYEWYDQGAEGPLSVRISLDRQIAVYERAGKQVGWSYVATGAGQYATKEGSFKILEKKVEKVSNQYGKIVDAEGKVVDADATPSDPLAEGQQFIPSPMPYWMRLTPTGIGMHGGPIPKPGRPASHGCIRMPRSFVSKLFAATKVGTPVTIVRDFPVEELAMNPVKAQAKAQ